MGSTITLNKRNHGSVYVQHDIFTPELFIPQIEMIKNKNEKILDYLYVQICRFSSSELETKKSCQQFLSLIESFLEVDKIKR